MTISSSDGSLQSYIYTNDFQINSDKVKLKISNSGNTIYFAGSISIYGPNLFGIWDTVSTNYNAHTTASAATDVFSIYSDSDDWVFLLYDFNQDYGFFMLNSTTQAQIWAKNLS